MGRSVKSITNFVLAAALLATTACEIQKSENPLSPSLAGPLPGVTITAPQPTEPPAGAEVLTTNLPLRLSFANATSDSPRPFWHVVEIAADQAFSNVLYRSERLDPDPSGRTTVVVPGQLPKDATYYWRVRAEDGANSSAPSNVAFFQVVEPVVIDPPVPVSPVGGATTASLSPDFVLRNATVSGPAGFVAYRVQVARDQAFAAVVASVGTARSGGSTTTINVGTLEASTRYYWRAWGGNGTITSAMSAIQSFRTPAAAPAPAPTPGPTSPSPAPTGGSRTPDPAPGQRLPLPNMSSVVQQVAREHPGALRNSCQDTGGTWEFMDRVVDRLRQYDTRWGYNWKRGNVGDPSEDVVDYHWGRGGDEGSTEVYIIDIIGGHCGSSPSPGWGDVTDVTRRNGTIGRWTGRGRF